MKPTQYSAIKKSYKGRGVDWKYKINRDAVKDGDMFLPDDGYVGSSEPCLLKCLIVLLDNEEDLDMLVPKLRSIYELFCVREKIKNNMFPICKINKFLDLCSDNHISFKQFALWNYGKKEKRTDKKMKF